MTKRKTKIIAASLNSSGTGSSNYSSIKIYPTKEGVMVSGSLNSSLISLNGADNVTIDGRVNGVGTTKSLTISNTSTGNAASTIRLINGAQNNNVKYAIISGSNRGSDLSATIFFGTATGSGNSNNTIIDNTITTSSTLQLNRPYRSILSNGTDGSANTNISILNNEFVDVLNPASSSYGIRSLAGSNNWTISGNHFYQTDGSFTPTENNTYAMIDISNTNGNGFVITDNFIGGRAINAGGSPFNISGAASTIFCGVRATVGTITNSTIENNTIKNIYHSSSNDIAFFGIRVNDGNVNVKGNLIGNDITLHCPVVKATATATISGGSVTGVSMTSAGSGYTTSPSVIINGGGGSGFAVTPVVSNGQVSLTISNSGSGYTSAPTITISGSPLARGIYIAGTGTIELKNNTISGITTSGSNANSVYSFYGIESAGNSPRTISENIIGSDTQSNSIVLSNPTTNSTQAQSFYGIYSTSSNSTDISNNIVANINNAAINSVASLVRGILVTAGSATIEGNVVHDLETGAAYASAIGTNGTIAGIQNESSGIGSVQSIKNNKIYSLRSLASSAEVRIRGIHFKGLSSGTHVIEKNFVHSLSVASTSTTAQLFGIQIESGTTNLTNNIINVGSGSSNGTQIFGIWESGTSTNNLNLYHNTIVISGSTSNNSALTYALFSNSSANTKVINNNIFTNMRSSGSGTNRNFALRLQATTGTTIDANDYFVNGTAGTILRLSGTNYSTLATWQSATSQDANSYNLNPSFTSSPPTNNENHYVPLCGMNGLSGLVASDYNGLTRSNPATIGAFEVSSRIPKIDNITLSTCSGAEFSVEPVNGYIPNGTSYSWLTPVVTGSMLGGASGSTANNVSGTLTNATIQSQTATYTVTPSTGSCQGANFTIVVTVRPVISAGAISTTGESICSGGDPGLISSVTPAAGTNSQIIYSWRSSSDNFSKAISGATGETYNPPALLSSTTYRRYASDSECSTVVIQSIGEWIVNVGLSPQAGTISGPTNVCKGANADLVLNNSTGLIQWQSSSNNQNFVNVVGASVDAYTATNITATTYYRVIFTGSCGSSNSAVFTISVNQPTLDIKVNNKTISDGDYLWNGNVSSNGGLLNNWYVLNNGQYSLATTLPTSQTKVFIIDYVNASNCVSQVNKASIPELGTFESDNLFIGENASLTLSPNATINISGDMVVNGSLISNPTAKIVFNGSSIQKISGTQPIIIDNLAVDKPNGNLKLDAPVTVRGVLDMLGGNIVTSLTNILEIGTSVSNPGSINWVDGSVVGPMKRWFSNKVNNSQSSGIFPVGTPSVNRNAQVNFTEAPTKGGYLVASFKEGLAPDGYSNFPIEYKEGNNRRFIEKSDEVGYWELTPYDENGQAYGALDDVLYTLKLRVNVPTTVSQGDHILSDPSGIRIIRSKGSAQGEHQPWDLAGTHSKHTSKNASDAEIESVGVKGFSWFNGGGSSGTPLPVELLSFAGDCQENDHIITWKTASEHNSENFEIQSSRDGLIWNTIAVEKAAGNSNELLTYQYINSNFGNGVVYYRLKQNDIDGYSQIYDPIMVACSSNETAFLTYPNPSSNEFNLMLNDKDFIGKSTILIHDSKGKLITKRSVEIVQGMNLIHFEEPVDAGVYYLQIQNENKTSKLLKHVIY